jgi:paraquat-inducible protein A
MFIDVASHGSSPSRPSAGRLIICHDCGLQQIEKPMSSRIIACCSRCGAELYRHHPNSSDRTLAYALAALVLFMLANAFPIVGLKVSGDIVQTSLFGSVQALYEQGMRLVSGVVLMTAIVMPLIQIAALTYLLLPLKFNRVPKFAAPVFRALNQARSWSMVEVFILGVLVALVKLSHIAGVVPGIALWSYGGLMLMLAAAAAAFDPREFWMRISGSTSSVIPPSAAGPDLVVCHVCGMVVKAEAGSHERSCPQCGASLHVRKPDSIARTWAFLIAAMILYIPANVLPVMETGSLFGSQQDTIMSGVVFLWASGSWELAVIVFIASIVVPMAKIIALAFLLVSVQLRSTWQPRQRTRLYRVVELVGRWSMLDIYVITILVALVQLKALATITAGPAAIAFGAVVVLTMLAASSFDPRLIWDQMEGGHAGNNTRR